MALTDKLAAIADAIRGKTGGTDALTLDQMATEIATIETGGGGVTIQSGSFTPAENLLSYTIPIDGTVKNCIVCKGTNALVYGVRTLIATINLDGNDYCANVNTPSSGTSAAGNITAKPISFSDGSIQITSTTSVGYLVTERYNWVAW